jgi:hypothetical protein
MIKFDIRNCYDNALYGVIQILMKVTKRMTSLVMKKIEMMLMAIKMIIVTIIHTLKGILYWAIIYCKV